MDTEADAHAAALVGRLSPSRASDFTTCPLLYRFRAIDRLPEPPTRATAKGTLVHLVLERLFELDSSERTRPTAHAMVDAAWRTMCDGEPGYSELVPEAESGDWYAEAERLLDAYFRMEDPSSVEPMRRESPVEFQVADDLILRGLVDRIDQDDEGRLIVVDYKTGKAPSPQYESKAMFQMRFYALVIWRSTGALAAELRLMYLGDGQVLVDRPDEADLLATQRRLFALWDAIKSAHRAGDFRPRPSVLCKWCAFTSLCPAHDGQMPPLPRPPVA